MPLVLAPQFIVNPIVGNLVIAGSAYGDGSSKAAWTPSGAGTSRTSMAAEVIFKHTKLGTTQRLFCAGDAATGNNLEYISINSSDKIDIQMFVSGVQKYAKISTQVLQDPNAWYQIVVIRNGATLNVYLNGTEITAWDTDVDPGASDNGMFGHTEEHDIGGQSWSASNRFYDRISRVTYVDGGGSLTISDFGTAVGNGWQLADVSGLTYGTNGICFEGGTSISTGAESYGSSQTVTITGTITATNDSPTDSTDGSKTNGNYAAFNDEYQIGSTAYNNATYSQGRTHATYANGEGSVLSQAVVLGNGVYFEATLTTPYGSTSYDTVGFIDPTRYASAIANTQESAATGYSFFKSNGQKSDDGATLASYGSAWDTAGKVIGVYISPTGKIWYTIDGTLQNSATQSEVENDTGTSHAFTLSGFGQILPVLSARGSNTVWDLNCGQFAWNTSPYSGYAGLCTANTPAPTVTDPSAYFDTLLYTGTDTSGGQTITGGSDFGSDDVAVWLKSRSIDAHHRMHTSLTGFTEGDGVYPSSSIAAGGADATGYISAVSSTGFSVAAGATNANDVNQTSATFVAWRLRAGTFGSNTVGSITSTVSVADHGGFSIIAADVAAAANGTIGHGMGQAPEMIIGKTRDNAYSWGVYHKDIGETKALFLEGTNAATTRAMWNNTAPTSSVFSFGNSDWINNCVFYAFARTPGLIGIGSYTGNANDDGPYVVVDDNGVGFRPAFLMVKRTDSTGQWLMHDAVRNPYNVVNKLVWADASTAETTASNDILDFTANGFKIRKGASALNASGGTYIYLAFAEFPFAKGGIDSDLQARAR